MKHFFAVMAVLFGLAMSGGAHAAPMYATNIAYFDATGTLVGQKIQWCNNKRFSQGNTNSPYQRHDWTPCSFASDPFGGYTCRGSHSSVPGSESTISCSWVSNATPQGGIAVEGGSLLPPGMTVVDSCILTGDCSPQPPEPFVYPHVSL